VPGEGSISAVLDAGRGRLFAFVPVLIGAGVAAWFALPDATPGLSWLWGALALAGCAAVAAWRGPAGVRLAALAVLWLGLGFVAAALRAERVAAPVLPFRYFGPIEGRVVAVDRSYSDRMRLTLDRVVLEDVSPDRTPARVRIALHGAAEAMARPEPGTLIRATGHLVPPEGPIEPGAFDYRRMAWFRGLGALGYVREMPEVTAPPAAGGLRIDRLRHAIAQAVQARVPGDAGGFAAAILTGDRSGLGQEATEDLRASNLAHLLAISGLHMGLLTAFVFALVRHGLALVPPLALRLATKKIAAIVALAAGAFYLALSGGNVATERAFVMVAVFLGAVLLDRRALSLRSVAIAACLILVVQPEALVEPGFQMSFAATAALIAAFGAVRDGGLRRRVPRWAQGVAALVLSSAVAGFATAPIAAAHFNRMAEYGLLANLLAVPLMGSVVIPAAVLAGLLAPVGLAAPALWVLEQGSRWILFVAGWVGGLEGAVRAVPMAGPHVLGMIALGGVWLIAWPGRARWAGAGVLAVALATWQGGARPALLIASDGALLGVLGPEGRALSAPRGAGFVADGWLQHDADTPDTDQPAAAARVGFAGPAGVRLARLGDWRVLHLKGRAGLAALPGACTMADLVVIDARVWPRVPEGCVVIDQTLLVRTGAIAADLRPDGSLRLRAAHVGRRPWDRPLRRTRPGVLPPPGPPPGPWPAAWQQDGPAVAILRLPGPDGSDRIVRTAAP
jgi:competence protein ComEC